MARERSSTAATAALTDPGLIGPGTVLGRYRLVERIGEGGMGEVWKAHDDNLDRDVAIKMLLRGVLGDTVRRERFRREALVLSRLSHPGVATIFDFDARNGRDFLVMEYVAGGTLEARMSTGPLPLEKIMTLGAEIADALDNAHRHGFLHRDLKPGNIALTLDDHAKILDFGLALLLTASSTTGRMTQPGLIVGSLPYMAPEQLYGEAGDARTDVYALGVMLFEMTTGKKPFVKDRPESLMFAIANTAAPSTRTLRSETPDALDRLIADCLRKDPSHRPGSAAVVSQTLRGIRDGTSSSSLPMPAREVIRAIAVLPLRNVSNDPSQEYFADGLTESIISDLARNKTLRVISRTSVMTYKGVSKPIPEIARELNVDAVLEGSAHLVGKRVRMHVQLVLARTDDTLWAERYDRELEDVFDLQSELAASITREIAVQLSPEEQPSQDRVVVNPEAHLEYLKSRHAFYGGSPQAIEVALRHARRALELDPGSALAWSALADGLIFRAVRGASSSAVASVEAMDAAKKALDIDPSLAEAHHSIGMIKSFSGDVAGGLQEFRTAVQLNPGMAAAHNLLGRSLYAYERYDEALEFSNKSVVLDPLSSLMRGGLGDAYYFARDYEKSLFHYRMSIELDSRSDAAHTGLARALEMVGRLDEARSHYETGLLASGGVAAGSFGLAHVEAAAGNEARAREMLAQLISNRSSKIISAWGIAVLCASLGDVDETFKWLDIAVAEKAPGLMVLRCHPRLDPIRNDARYSALVEKLGLDDATFERIKS